MQELQILKFVTTLGFRPWNSLFVKHDMTSSWLDWLGGVGGIVLRMIGLLSWRVGTASGRLLLTKAAPL